MCFTIPEENESHRDSNVQVEYRSKGESVFKVMPNSLKFPAPKGWGTRHTFLVLGFFGFVLCYALRFNLSIAIVTMTKPEKLEDLTSKRFDHSYGRPKPNRTTFDAQEICPSNFNTNKSSSEDGLLSSSGLYSWTEEQQGLILGSFFWGYVVTQYPGGKLSHVYGPKWVFSIGIVITGLLSLALPYITEYFDYQGLIILRVVQGLAEGVTLPSALVMLSHWAPSEERNSMTNWVYAGIPIGTAVTMVGGGYLIYFFDWPSVFYVTGVLSIVWFVLWGLLVFNEPLQHPRISQEELEYIQKDNEPETDLATPWLSIIKSKPVWAILITDLGDSWSHYLLHVEVPIYLSSVHGFTIKTDGWFSALPQMTNCLLAIFIGYAADFIINRKLLSTLCTRKLCSAIALYGSAIGFAGMIFGGCDTITAIISLNVAAGLSGASNSGWIVNHIEIAPNHAGTISGVANSIGNCLGFVAPYATGLILHNWHSLVGWQIAFAIPVVIQIGVSLVYLTLASADEQPWNNIGGKVVSRKSIVSVIHVIESMGVFVAPISGRLLEVGVIMSVCCKLATIRMYSKCPLAMYLGFVSVSVIVPILAHLELPKTIIIHQHSKSLIHKWKIARKFTKNDAFYLKVFNSLKPCTFFSSFSDMRFITFETPSLILLYYDFLLNCTVNALISTKFV